MSKRKTRIITYTSIVAIGSIVGVLAMLRYDNLTAQDSTAVAAPAATSIAIVTATRERLTAWATAEGTVHAWRRGYLQSDANGIVAELGVVNGRIIREGDPVTGPKAGQPGDLLVRLDSRTLTAEKDRLEAELKGAQADLAQAECNYRRIKSLHGKKLSPQADLEQSLASYETAQARVDATFALLQRAKINIGKTAFRAPFDGIIKRINVRVGDYYAGSSQWTTDSDREANSLLVIIDPKQLEARLNISFHNASQLKVGQRVYLANSSRELSQAARSHFKSGNVVAGTLYSKSPSISLDKRSMEVKARTQGTNQTLLDGSHIVAWIVVNERENILTVPHRAVVGREKGMFAYVYDEETKTVSERLLTIGEYGLDDVEIIEGIVIGESVVVDGLANLTDGAPAVVVRNDNEKRS